jgi:hypothetical protein
MSSTVIERNDVDMAYRAPQQKADEKCGLNSSLFGFIGYAGPRNGLFIFPISAQCAGTTSGCQSLATFWRKIS